ncbi:MAG: AbrB family transcriptional regulator [Desulfovibrio sp.]|jgi:membrane AbrB-like protein|nr:AbrB family transcriptional regulator [Desulfovibrio sp.]
MNINRASGGLAHMAYVQFCLVSFYFVKLTRRKYVVGTYRSFTRCRQSIRTSFFKKKVPGGLLIGSLVGVAALNIAFNTAYMPSQTKFLVQILAGAFIGSSIEKSDLARLPSIIKPTVIMLGAFLVLNLFVGGLIYLVSPLDLVTSLMSAVPGGISDTPIIADDMGADAPKVVVMQMIRQVLGIAILPGVIFAYDNRAKRSAPLFSREANIEKRKKSDTKSIPALVCTVVVASLFGYAGRVSGIAGATFAAAIIGVLILKLVFDFAFLSRWIKKGAQILSGCYFGSTILMQDVIEMQYLLLPIFILVLGYVANCFITGNIISRTSGFTRKESMLITTPAGASDMALISEDIGVKNTDVIIMQVIRAVVVMTFFPQIVNLILLITGK